MINKTPLPKVSAKLAYLVPPVPTTRLNVQTKNYDFVSSTLVLQKCVSVLVHRTTNSISGFEYYRVPPVSNSFGYVTAVRFETRTGVAPLNVTRKQ